MIQQDFNIKPFLISFCFNKVVNILITTCLQMVKLKKIKRVYKKNYAFTKYVKRLLSINVIKLSIWSDNDAAYTATVTLSLRDTA